MPFPVDDLVLQRVPHRPPILRVHRLVAADGEAGTVAGSEPTGPGALPWAAGAIEGIAQSAALVLAGHAPKTEGAPRGMLVAVKKFVAHGEPPAGAEILYHVVLVRRLGAMALVRGEATFAGQLLAGGELTLWTPPE